MKAIIMAGGEGSRLRPLTCDCPKPMAPVMDKPVMEYALKLLKHHGVRELAVTLQYLPERVMEYFGDGGERGQAITYYTERVPLGTAGSVKQAEDFLDETFCVLSGDGLTDCDLTAAYRFHKERGALATLVLKRVETPIEYGVVVTESDGRVRRFVEKPGWGEVASDAVNTGIYILEPEALSYIPEGKPYDFGRELFPTLVEKGLPVYGYAMGGYWCDIGDIAAYLSAHADLLEGKIPLFHSPRPGGVCKQPGALVDKGALLEGPCFIGAGARVEEGARIGAYTVLGAGSVVERRASVKRSVLWRGARVGEQAQARGCVLQFGSTLGARASAFEESAIGDGAAVGEAATLMPGVRVWPHKQIADNEKVDQNVVWGARWTQRFVDGFLPLQTPAQAVRDAQAYADALRPREVLLGRDASAISAAYLRAATAGLMAQGVQAIEAGAVTIAQLRAAAWSVQPEGVLYLRRDGMLPMTGRGAPLARAGQRALTGAMARQDGAGPFAGLTKPPMQLGRSDLSYIGLLTERLDAALLREYAPKVAVYAQYEQVLSLCERVMLRAGCTVRAEWEEELMELAPGEVGVWLNDSGESAAFADEEGALGEAQGQLLLAWTALEAGATTLVEPTGATEAVEQLAERYGAEVLRVKSERGEWMRALEEVDRTQFLLQFDGTFAACKALERLAAARLSLRDWLRGMPAVFRRSRVVPIQLKEKGRVLRALAEEAPEADLRDGVRVRKGEGWAWISPAGDGAECVVMGEAADAEFAKEICDFFAGKVERLARG